MITRVELVPNDNPAAPLAAKLELAANEPVRLELGFDDGQRQWTVVPNGHYAEQHALPVLGLHPGKRHAITAIAVDAAGNETMSEPFEITTAPLPENFPKLQVQVSEPERMEPGLTFFNLFAAPEEESDTEYGALVAVDSRGDVVWLYEADHSIGDARKLPSGNVLYSSGRSGRAFEIDMLGNVVDQWHTTGVPQDAPPSSKPVAADTIHHEILEMPTGNLLALSTELRDFDDYLTSETDPDAPRGKSTVVGDVLVEFSRDGMLVQEWKLLDVLDPYRIGFASLRGGFWNEVYEDVPHEELRDWAHINAVFYDAKDDAFILSSRRQDAIVKMTRDGELRWILAPHDNWRKPWSEKLLAPQGALEWPYHQHAPKVTPQGTILMFDNGTHRASPFTDQESMPAAKSYSRAVEYAVDEEKMEVQQIWTYGGPGDEIFYSSFIGDTDWLPQTGNVLVTDGGKISDAEWNPTDRPGVYRWARIVEVTHTTPPEKVFELTVKGEPPMGWHVYRADRVPSLYRN